MVLTCGDGLPAGLDGAFPPDATRFVPVAAVPGRAEVDPLLDHPALHAGGRLVVVGEDADLAAVLVRLLRRERLDVPVAFVPGGSAAPSEVAAVWGLPADPAGALAVARDGLPDAVPLVRDDRGGVVVGAHHVGAFDGVVYCDAQEVLRGRAAGLVVRPDPDGATDRSREFSGVAVTVTGPSRLGGLRRGVEHRARGRAATLGCRAATVTRDGVADERPVERRSWYRHTADWLLVRPGR